MPSFRIHSFTLILQNSIFKEILGRVLTHSGFYRKESSFLPFFKLTFTDKIKPEKAQLADGPDKVIIVQVSSTCIAQGQLQLGGAGEGAQMHAECCSSDLDDVCALYPLLCCSCSYQKGNFKIAQNDQFSQKGEKDNLNFNKLIKPFAAVSPAAKTEPGTEQLCNNFFDERNI